MPSARCNPVPLSPICAPVTSGSPSRKPVVEAAPPVHWATFSYTLQSSKGPGPKPLIEATIIFGLMLWIFSQGKPMRSSTPGPKFSTSTSQLLISAVRTSLPFGFLVSSVIERLLWFSMVKYRLSTLGMSCNWPRVMSPTPGRSTLITSAPNQASNCVQVGPDWTWVKSRMRTPLSALVMIYFLLERFDGSRSPRQMRQTRPLGYACFFLLRMLCGLRLPMRPLSEPDAGSITALISVGLPDSIAALTARFNSSGVVALTPTPPNASIILS